MRIAVIGGGAGGTLVCAQLLRHTGAKTARILWLGNQEPFGPGKPYGPSSPLHRLNVRASGMSAFGELPEHFVNWMAIRFGEHDPDRFWPRQAYGDYLRELIDPAEPRVQRRRAEVVGIERVGGGFRLTLDLGDTLACDAVVLATGLVPGAPDLDFDGDTVPAGLARSARVLILGTGLTMVDLALELCERGGQAPVHALSRRGLLPRAHAEYQPWAPSSEFSRWLPWGNGNLRDGFRLFRRECGLARRGGSDWRAVFDLIRPHAAAHWRALPPLERRRFLRHAERLWDVHRHRMDPEIAARIEGYQREGRLVLHRARIGRLEREGAGWRLLARRPVGPPLEESYDFVLNATGLGHDLAAAPPPLVRSLIGNGLLVLDEPPLGAHAAPGIPGFHVLGPLLRGRDWESIAIPEIRAQAAAIAEAILGVKAGLRPPGPT